MIRLIQSPWPWYVAGPLIGLVVPLLLIFSNKQFGISSSFRHILSPFLLHKISYFNYKWRNEIWNLFFVFGIILGAFIGFYLIGVPDIKISPEMKQILSNLGVTDFKGLMPDDYFKFIPNSYKGLILTFGGGFFIGFGTRWANGCTAGHTIMGLAQLSFTSLIATCCFFIGGLFSARILLPFILTHL